MAEMSQSNGWVDGRPHGTITMSRQLYEQTKATEDAWRELEWTALHYDEATDEQRANLERTLAAIDRMED